MSKSDHNKSPNKHATIGFNKLKVAQQTKVIKRTHGFTLDDSLDILGVEAHEKHGLRDDLAAKPLTHKCLLQVADHLPDDWDDVMSIVSHLEPPSLLTEEDIESVRNCHLSNAGRALLLLEKWLNKLKSGKNSGVTVTNETLATAFARAGQTELVGEMIAPFRTHRFIDDVLNESGEFYEDLQAAAVSMVAAEVAEFKVESSVGLWYHPDLTRKQAEDFVKPLPPGSFVVRNSGTVVGAYALTVKVPKQVQAAVNKIFSQQSNSPDHLHNGHSDDNKMLNVIISRTASGKFKFFRWKFDSLYKLISQLLVKKLGLPCTLILPEVYHSVPTQVQNQDEIVQQKSAKAETDSKILFDEAMQFGFVVCHAIILLFIGVAGAGKSSFGRFVLDLPPLKIRESTPLAECAVRAISVSRAKLDQGGTTWSPVTPDVLLNLIADGIKGGLTMFLAENMPISPTKPITAPQRTDSVAHLHDTTDQREISKPIDNVSSSKSETKRPSSATGGSASRPSSTDISPLTTTAGKDGMYACLFDSEVIQELLKQIDASDGSRKLHEDDWVYLIDSGGQPQFHELLPTFVHHASGAVFFVKLNEELNSRPTIEYYRKGGELSGDPYPSSLTHLQILQNCLQTMQSRNNISGEIECPELFFVGTHRDLESTCKESVAEKNQRLHEMLLQHDGFKNHLSYYCLSKPEVLMYPVDSITPQDCDREVVSDFRSAVINSCKKNPVKIPIVWFLLEQLLQKLSRKEKSCVLSFEKCLDVAKDLRMDEPRLKAALEFLVRLNIFKYFPQVLPNVVFVTAQVLLDKVSELVEYSHLLRCKPNAKSKSRPLSQVGRDSESQRFRDHGTVSAELFKKFPAHFVKDLFDTDDLLQLLVHLLVVARISEDHYFMPCVLPELTTEELTAFRLNPSKNKLAPLLIHYPGQWFPSGIFTSLISFLENRSHWKVILKHGTPACLYKNCVKFRLLGTSPITITLIYSLKYIEIHVRVPDDDISKDICLGICSIVLDGLENASKVQNYKHLLPQLAFFCTFSHDDDPSDGSVAGSESFQLPHLALVSKNQKWLVCSLDEENCTKVSKMHSLWLIETEYEDDADIEQWVNEISGSADLPSLDDKPRLYELKSLKVKDRGHTFKIIEEIASKWEQVAIHLDFEQRTINNIARDNVLSCENACEEMLRKWLRDPGQGGRSGSPAAEQVSWRRLIETLPLVNYDVLAEELKKSLK